MSVRYTGHQHRELDKLAGKVVRGRSGGRCELCGRGPVTWAHIRRRRFKATRWDPRCALALCVPCHTWADSSPVNMEKAVDNAIAAGVPVLRYDHVKRLSLKSADRLYSEMRTELIAEARRLGVG